MDDIIVHSGGTGYFVPPKIEITGGGGSGATARAIISAGAIIDVVVENRGNGYITTPTVTVLQETSTPAVLVAKMRNNKVRSF